MKLFIFFLYISLLSLPLLAQRVIITKTANKNSLNTIHAKLKTLDIKMYVKKYNNYYFIYTKKYQTAHRAETQLRKIQTLFPSAKLEKKKSTHKKIQDTREWRVEVGTGSSSIGADSGISYSLTAGYLIKEHFLSTLSYSYSSVEQTKVSNFYFSQNYYYDITQNSDVYIGALLGYSSLLIDSESSTPSGSAMYGFQAGVSYDIFSSIPLSLTYKSIFFNHSIAFTSTTGTVDIPIKTQNIIEISLAYKF